MWQAENNFKNLFWHIKKDQSIVLTYNHTNLNYFMCFFMIHKHNYIESRTFDKTADMLVIMEW